VPDNPVVWIIAIVAVFVVVLVALWKGQMVEVELKPLRLRFKRQGSSGGGGISVGDGMVIKGSKTGDIAGVKGSGAAAPEGDVSVGKGAQITDATTGDIVGVKQTGATETGGGEKKP
jgi:hypothetical protein